MLGLGQPSDEQVMGRVQADGDAEAFALLVARWQAPVQSLCWRMLGDRHRAEDLTQETFARLFSRRAQYRPAARFSTYLWQIALNLCRDELRRRGRNREDSFPGEAVEELPRESALAEPESPRPDIQLSEQERAQSVRDALAQLSPLYREVLVLRHYEGLKFREIAAVLEIPEGTVKSRMVEALDRMAALLERGGGSDPVPRRDLENFVL